ncbi:MAG TPA: hypothetical protein PKJ33_00065 [Alphaproteobacteria bacterium]|nr:hypothetical protein [Alphaproteobacteria bacterium]
MKKVLTSIFSILILTPAISTGLSDYKNCKLNIDSEYSRKELSLESQQKLDTWMKTPLTEDRKGTFNSISYSCPAGTLPSDCSGQGKDILKSLYEKYLKQMEIDAAVKEKCTNDTSIQTDVKKTEVVENLKNTVKETNTEKNSNSKESFGSGIKNMFKSDKKKLAEATQQATDSEKQALEEFNTSVQIAKSEFERKLGI